MNTHKHTIKKLLTLITLLTGLGTVAQAGTLSDETKRYTSQGYTITQTGVMFTERGFSGTYFVMMTNLDALENQVIVCEKRYDSKKTDCYGL